MPATQTTLFDEPYEVSEITAELRDLLNEEYASIAVQGEVSNLKKHISGHYYFSLKDAQAVLKCKMWKSNTARLKFDMKDGLHVVVRGQLDFYPPHGECSLTAAEITPHGMGALELAFRQLFEKLQAQGWFDPARKKPIPLYPKRLGLVTSEKAAALQDMLRILRDRWPLTDIWIIHVPVQGDTAAPQIAKTLKWVNTLDPAPDLLILARGGGSQEDLWAFNEEVVAQAIFQSKIPIIAGIGHETDTTIADLVADLRAPTPTAAAQRAVPSASDWHDRLSSTYERLQQLTIDQLQWEWDRLQRLRRHRLFANPMQHIDDARQQLDEAMERLVAAIQRRLLGAQQLLAKHSSVLAALSPLQVLGRGYSLTRDPDTGKSLVDARSLSIGSRIETILARGKVSSVVESVEKS